MVAINEVSNQEGYAKEYLPAAQKTIKEHGGIYVAAGTGTQIAGGLPNGRVVVLRWQSMEALMGWRNSPEYQEALKNGEKFAKYNIIAVPECSPNKASQVWNSGRPGWRPFYLSNTTTMSEPRYRNDIRHDRVPLRVRKVGDNRYRITDLNGRGLEYRKRGDFTSEALAAIDAANGKDAMLEGWLNRFGRWSISGVRDFERT